MKEKKYPKIHFENNEHLTTCILEISQNDIFLGYAKCHENDLDFENEITGCHIAMGRAQIHAYQHIKNNRIRPTLSYLKGLYSQMSQSSNFDENSYEAQYLRKEIKKMEQDFKNIKLEIKEIQEYLKDYIAEKDDLYKKLRANRTKSNN